MNAFFSFSFLMLLINLGVVSEWVTLHVLIYGTVTHFIFVLNG